LSADRLQDLRLRPINFYAKGCSLFLQISTARIHTLSISVSSTTSSAKSRSEKDSDLTRVKRRVADLSSVNCVI